jgi:hypothetical protein
MRRAACLASSFGLFLLIRHSDSAFAAVAATAKQAFGFRDLLVIGHWGLVVSPY